MKELPWVPCSREIHQEQIYRNKVWWGACPVGKHQQNNGTNTADVDKFIKLLVHSVDNLPTQPFIAKSQALHLKQRKEEVTEIEFIILLDFAENYHYVAQDKILGISLEQGPV